MKHKLVYDGKTITCKRCGMSQKPDSEMPAMRTVIDVNGCKKK